MATPFITDAEATQKIQQSYSQLQTQLDEAIFESVKVYDSLADAQAVDPKPVDGTVFQVSEVTDPDNAGYYSFQSSEPEGIRFERENNTIKIKEIQDLVDKVVYPSYTNLNSTIANGHLNIDGTPGGNNTYRRTSTTNASSMFNVVTDMVHTYTGEITNTSYAGVLYFDESLNLLGYECNEIRVYENYPLTLPVGTKYIASCSKDVDPIINTRRLLLESEILQESLSQLQSFSDIEKTVSGINDSFDYQKLEASFAVGAIRPTGNVSSGFNDYFRTSASNTSAFNVKENTTYYYTGEIADVNLAGILFLDEDFNLLGFTCSDLQVYSRFQFITPVGTRYIASCSKGMEPILEHFTFKSDSSAVYVSQNSVDGDGSLENPYTTITEAVRSGAKSIVIYGGDYREILPFSAFSNGDYELIAKEGERVRVLGSEKLDAWTLHSGDVYTRAFNTPIPLWDRYNTPIFEDGNPSHPIDYNERHPLQKSLSYRLPFTPIYRVDTLNEVLSTPGTYFHNETEGNIYMHTSDGSNPNTNGFSYEVPLHILSNYLNANTNKKVNLKMHGLQFMFGSNGVRFRGFNKVERHHCTALGVKGAGAFVDDTGTILSYYDEVGFCDNDGINGHFSSFSGFDTLTDHRSMSPHTIYFEPWAHDNHDDGMSHHENHNVSIYGGLIEYNGDGGIRASNDSGYIVDRVYSRKNGWDTGAGEGIAVVNPIKNPNRNGCKMVATGCFLEENAVGVSSITSDDNVIEVINCTLRNNTIELKAEKGKIISRNNKVTNTSGNIKDITNGAIEVINDEILI